MNYDDGFDGFNSITSINKWNSRDDISNLKMLG